MEARFDDSPVKKKTRYEEAPEPYLPTCGIMFGYYIHCGTIEGPNARDAASLYQQYIDTSDGYCADTLRKSESVRDKWHIWRQVSSFDWIKADPDDKGIGLGNGKIQWMANIEAKDRWMQDPDDLMCYEDI